MMISPFSIKDNLMIADSILDKSDSSFTLPPSSFLQKLLVKGNKPWKNGPGAAVFFRELRDICR
jgi:hypothetical protein